MSQYSFPNKLRLKRRKSINNLFDSGNVSYHFPIRMSFLEDNHEDNSYLKAGFSVPKRNFKKAVERNLLKRRMREAFRLNKNLILSSEASLNKSISVFFIYSGKEILSFKIIEEAIKKCLLHLKNN